MVSQRLARYVAMLIALVFLIQIIPYGQADSVLVEQPQSHSTARIIAYGSGIATALLGINQTKATVQFSYTNFTDATFSSFVRVDTKDSILAQCKDPTIAIAPNEDIIIVWSQTYLSYSRIFISRSLDRGDSFSTPILITETATGNQTGPEVAVANGVIYVVWTEFVPGKNDTDIFLARSLDNGSSFKDFVRVDHTGSSKSMQGFPEIAARANDVFVVWHDSRDDSYFNIYGAISHDQGQAFGPSGDVRISDGTNDTEQSRPDVVYLNDGRILVIWQDRRTGDYDVRGAISTDGISFSPSFLVSDGPLHNDQSDPRLVADPRGFVSVTWRDNRFVTGYHIFTRSSFNGINYGPSRRVDNAPLATNCYSPDIAASQNGSVFVAWSDDHTGTSEVYIKALPNLAPHIVITSPVEGAARSGQFPITCEASDPEGSPQLSVQVQLQNSVGNNLTPWSAAPLTTNGTWGTSINSSHFANGNYRIASRSFDGLVYSPVAIINVTFDNTRPPYIELTLALDRVHLYPNDPMALQNVTIIADVYNIGTKNATDVLVRFSWLNGSTPEIIGERTLASVSSGDHATALVNWIAVQGNVTIIVQLDPLNAIVEDNKTNNTVTKMIHVELARPDIEVTSSGITISPDLIYSGDAVNFTAVLTNQGENIALSFDVTFRVNGTLVSTKPVDQLLPHQTILLTTHWTAVGGSHILQVNADPSHSLDDANLANNVAESAFDVIPEQRPLPDLTVVNGTQLIYPVEPMIGQNVTFSAIVSNLGNVAATDVNVTFYLDGELLAYRSITEVNASETVGISLTWLAVLGHHDLSIAIDPNHLVQERNRTNNIASRSFTVSPVVFLIADLAVSQASISMDPANPTMGNVVYVNVTVNNIGNGSAENVLIIGKMDGQQVGLNKHIPYFPSNSSRIVSFTWFANEGEHAFQIYIDPYSNITESSKVNNNASKTFELSGPSDITNLIIAAGFVAAAIAVMALYVLRNRKK